jgi:hypothetical protein
VANTGRNLGKVGQRWPQLATKSRLRTTPKGIKKIGDLGETTETSLQRQRTSSETEVRLTETELRSGSAATSAAQRRDSD